MRLHHFFIEELVGNKTEIKINSAELTNQIRRVFRLKTGDSVVVFDGSGFDYECRIGAPSVDEVKSVKNLVTLDVVTTMKSRYMPTRDIYLCAGIVKKDTFEWIVEKATELGVTHIIPVMAERSEKKALNMGRLEKIAIEASEQSGRGNVPTIQPIGRLKEVIERFSQLKCMKIVFHTDAEPFNPQDVPRDIPVAVFIGPEGGWSMDEIDLFHKNNVQVFCLGSQVLRSETAVVVALSQVVFTE
jgi:16S rRNA (uracil1498-N3)-methyltransferase